MSKLSRLLRLYGFIAIICLSAGLSFGQVNMENYCMQPAFTGQIIHPNVLIFMANSQSLGRRAYMNAGAYSSSTTYFGHFDSDSYYTYSGVFTNVGLKSAGCPGGGTDCFDGNFMNFMTMRRNDLISNVLAGGKDGSRNRVDDPTTDLLGNCAQGDYNPVADAQTIPSSTVCAVGAPLVDNTGLDCTTDVVFELIEGNCNNNHNPSKLQVTNNGNTDTFDLEIDTSADPRTGVLQDNDYLIRWGLENLNGDAGGNIPNSVSIIGQCSSNFMHASGSGSFGFDSGFLEPSGSTAKPLAEGLWTALGYFAQGEAPAASSDLGTGGVTSGANGPEYPGGTITTSYDPYNYQKDVDETATHKCDNSAGLGYIKCNKSFILMLTDGEPTSDTSLPASVDTIEDTYAGTILSGACVDVGGGLNGGHTSCAIDNVTLYGNVIPGTGRRDLRDNSSGAMLSGDQNVQTFIVQASFDGGTASSALQIAARNGGFSDSNGNFVPDLSSEWDHDGDGVPDNFFYASDPSDLKNQLDNAIRAILRRAASGTASSIIGAGKGSGANLLQAFFFPEKDVISSSGAESTLTWIGFLQNFWFEVDPLLRFTNIRDDSSNPNGTGAASPDLTLNQQEDAVIAFQFDSALGKTQIFRFLDVSPFGEPDLNPATPAVTEIDAAYSLWEAGLNLFTGGGGTGQGGGSGGGDTTGANRNIFTSDLDPANVSDMTRMNFDPDDTTTCQYLAPLMQSSASECTPETTPAANDGGEAWKLMKYVRGTDFSDFRNRTAVIDVPPYATAGQSSITGTWKLGDIVDSTAKIQGKFALNDYDIRYHIQSYSDYTNSDGQHPDTPSHPYSVGASLVYSGANDGMLHAYSMGQLDFSGLDPGDSDTPPDVVHLGDPDLVGNGSELWAYLPKNSLPYLRYLADPDYCHLYYVDLTPKVFDASINAPSAGDTSYVDDPMDIDTWRTIVIGGMGLGGANSCSSKTEASTTDCISSPDITDSILDAGGSAQVIGRSSYFALDVTSPYASTQDPSGTPHLLWEFSDPDLGYATAAPLVARIGDRTHNGHWYAIFGSGPTGPLNQAAHQFLGRSNQHARVFVLDLKTGTKLATIDLSDALGIAGLDKAWVSNIVAGDITNSDADAGEFTDEVFYISTVQYNSATGEWDSGRVYRLYTKDDEDPTNWTVNNLLNQNVGPVTSKVAGLSANNLNDLWLFFGTGRFFYRLSNSVDDSGQVAGDQRILYGMKDPCFKGGIDPGIDFTCTDTVDVSSLHDSSDTITTAAADPGWFINLCTGDSSINPVSCPPAASTDLEERNISDPIVSSLGCVFFTTFQPSNDVCTFGGVTYIYALKFDTGGTCANFLFGTGIVQTSTGAVTKIDLGTSFGERTATNSDTSQAETKGRRSIGYNGVPPGEAPFVPITPPPIQKVLRLKEN